MKIKLAYFIVLIQLIIAFISNFLGRYIISFDQSSQIFFSFIFVLLLLFYINKKVNINLGMFIILAITILAIGIIRNQFFLNIFQLFLIVSNFIFILFKDKFDDKSVKNLLKIVLFFSFLQLFFDVFFPKNVIDLQDQFSGTFIMANNKARFLFFILPLAYYLPSKFYLFRKKGKLIFIISILISAYLGHSSLGFTILILSLFLAFFVKNIYLLLIIYITILFALSSILKYYVDHDKNKKKFTHIEMNYHRFFHEEHGVKAVYIYGIEKLKQSLFIGVGYGNFSSRSGQFFNSDITKNIPKQLIKFWQPLFETKAPYGLSSLFVLIVELGILSFLPIIILFKWLNKLLHSNNYFLRVMVIYTFFIINYNPTFFEFNESFLFLLTLLLISKYKKNEKNPFFSEHTN